MSGGSLDYAYCKVEDIASSILSRAETPLHKAFAKHLQMVASALHDLEWVWSGDCSPGDEEKSIRKIITRTDELKSATEDARKLIKILSNLISDWE